MNVHSRGLIIPLPEQTPDQAPAPAQPQGRALEILQAIRPTFAEKGFEGASMQDLARAAGISVGSFYRYFPSKVALFEGMVTLSIAEKSAILTQVLTLPDPIEALRQGVAEHLREIRPDDDRLWGEINAAAQRRSDLGAICARMEAQIAEQIEAVFAHATGLSAAETAARFGAHARYIVMVVRAAVCRPNRSDDPQLDELTLRGINLTLDDIAAACGPKVE